MTDLFALAKPLLHALPAETAHRLTLRMLATGWLDRAQEPADPLLATTLLGHPLAHPIGLAAGFDKSAVAVDHLHALGFSFVEIGGVTPLPQAGNKRPRLFRLVEDRAVINRMGFNNDGAAIVAGRLVRRERRGMVAVNLANNSDARDPIAEFASLVERFAPVADALTLDISCPNTANGALFLEAAPLGDLLDRIDALRASTTLPPVLIKLGPDLTTAQLDGVLAAALGHDIAGLIATNTTRERPDALVSRHRAERGGLSGPPLFARSTALIATLRASVPRTLTIIGVGGVASGRDAYAKIAAGADAVQLYTALVYQGPAGLRRITHDLAACLRAEGHASVAEAVGSAVVP